MINRSVSKSKTLFGRCSDLKDKILLGEYNYQFLHEGASGK
jgi:hypothetical protein